MGLKGELLFMLLFVGGLSESADQWPCKNGKMILEYFKCDTVIDCDDGSDERTDICSGKLCPEGMFTCRSIHNCIRNVKLCDGVDDCPDGTDEVQETCSTGTTPAPACPAYEFTCSNGSRCLPRKYVCDGRNDCHDGSDENIEMCCNSKLDIGNQTSPCLASSTSISPSPSTTSLSPRTSTSTLNPPGVPSKCLRKPCNKKCKRFWDVLPQVLKEKVKSKEVRKCSKKKKVPKRCLKCKALLLKLGLDLGLSTPEVRPGGKRLKRGKKRCKKNPKRKGCKVTKAPTLS